MLDAISPSSDNLTLASSMDSFHFSPGAGATQTKTEDSSMEMPFSGSFDDDLDHRKRRRNRTTQSCWSCHQAKRKCDRKRPCSRCIQLGLTGLCVYETDDPASRDDPSLSETQRLRKRIAELEALVREMKNKPHPRWADKVSSGSIGVDKWHTRAKYVVGNGDFDESYPYRFPPLDGAGAYDSFSPSSSSSTVLPAPGFDPADSRRHSIASSVSSTSSPRTPYSYHLGVNGGSVLSANPCNCLSSNGGNTARGLASAIRHVVFDSGITHPFSEGCKVLALVRELENIADSNSPTAVTTNGFYSNSDRSHSASSSPHPPSSSSTSSSPHSNPMHSLPHPLQITPPTPLPTQSQQQSRSAQISYASPFPPISHPSLYAYHHSPGSSPQSSHSQSQHSAPGDIGHSHTHHLPQPPTVPSMGGYPDFGNEYGNHAGHGGSPSKYGPLTGLA